ncbi:MAG TPA: enoyl-CoA hydratase-related protein [Rubrivivax sp.]|nr:enoyl-CoA hydratase-related protein [Rubrivivax sp.]
MTVASDTHSAWTAWQVVQGEGLNDFSEIVYEKKRHLGHGGGVARISLNKPDKMNTLTMVTVDEMFRAFYDANHDPMTGVIVVAGRGKNFGAGGDVQWERWGLREAVYNRYPHNRLIRLSRKPVIAQVQGYCIAGHNHMAYCCDFTIAADNAVFGQAGPRVSSPADGFFVPYLTKVVGAKKAREMWMLCRKYSAQQALEMGLVNTVVPLDALQAEVDRWCEEMLALSPGCLEILKASFDQEMDGYRDPCVTSAAMYPDWFDNPEGNEGGAAFLAKRKPQFWPLREREADSRNALREQYAAAQSAPADKPPARS